MVQILIVDDDENSRLIVSDLLEIIEDYELIEAVTGPEGVTAAELHLPDLILMDLQLPGFDGFEAIERIKANPALEHIPIIVITSYAMSPHAARARAMGCGYVSKPFDLRVLLDTIRGHLS